MKIATLALLIVALVQADARAEERTPWRLGEPEVVWRYQPPPDPEGLLLFSAHLGTLVVHPEGGVVAVARTDDDHLVLFRVAASGTRLWERSLVVPVYDEHAHVTFLRGPGGVDTIVTTLTLLARLAPDGAIRWVQTAARVGIDMMGIAIAQHAPAGDQIVVGGEGGLARDSRTYETAPVAMAASLAGDGTRRWLSVIVLPGIEGRRPPPILAVRRFGEAYEPNPDAWIDRQIPTVALPLRIQDDGGAVALVGCGELGAAYAGHNYPWPLHTPPLPCEPGTPMSFVAIDSRGQSRVASTVGADLSLPRVEPLALPTAVHIDTWLEAQGLGLSALNWDPRRLPSHLPSAWWFGPTTPVVVRFLRSRSFYGESHRFVAYGRRPAVFATFPVADVVVDRHATYLLLAPGLEYPGPRRVTLLAVRRGAVAVLAARAMPPLQRVRYAMQEGALYGLQGNAVVRIRVLRSIR